MIQSLPSEILLKIFGYLSHDSLFNVSQISTHWMRMTRNLGVYRLYFSRSDHDQLESDKKMIAQIKHEIPTFADGNNVRHLLIASHRFVSSDVFMFLQFLCPNVMTFDYDYDRFDVMIDSSTSWYQQRHSLAPCGNWQHSIVHLPACFDGIRILASDNVLCRRLESLYVGLDVLSQEYHGRYRLQLQDFPELTSLIFQVSYHLDETIISEIHRRCPRLLNLTLRNMSLSCMSKTKYPFVDEVFFPKPGLRVLNLENVTFMTYHTFCFFPNKYPNVNTLALSIKYKKNQKFDNPSSYKSKSIRECIYEMIVSFQHLSSVTVHWNGFGKKEDKVNRMYQKQIEDYFGMVLNRHIQVQVTYS